jgi:hypothetical protein
MILNVLAVCTIVVRTLRDCLGPSPVSTPVFAPTADYTFLKTREDPYR